jgi:hypothetical protein
MECVMMQHVVCQPPPQNALPQATFLAVCCLLYRRIGKGLHLLWPLAWDTHLARSTSVQPRLVPAQLGHLFGHLLAAFLAQWLPGIAAHECGLGRPGGFVERLRSGTYLALYCVELPLASHLVVPPALCLCVVDDIDARS